jgi:predicted O-methyltransferase YrrM
MHQKFNLVNVLRQLLLKDRRKVILNKIFNRVIYKRSQDGEYLKWINDNSIKWSDYLNTMDSATVLKVKNSIREIASHSDDILNDIPFEMGGAGCYPLVYLITKKLKPKIVVETGVAAGFSSYAALLALDENNKGLLFSSDFPYFRIKDPEKYIGCVVPDELKSKWRLYLDGDKNNLPKILSEIDEIDLLHYDSDKTYSGREFSMKALSPYFNENTVVIMDDIQDNSFFYDYIVEEKISDWKVIYFKGKYLGVIGLSNIFCNA